MRFRRKPLKRQPVVPSAVRRKRGAQPGNSNRLSHGRYSKAEAERRAAFAALLRKSDAMLIWANNILRARAALQRKRAAQLTSHLPLVGRSTCAARRVGGGASHNGPHPKRFALRPPHKGEVR
jgi:hypothetical protein